MGIRASITALALVALATTGIGAAHASERAVPASDWTPIAAGAGWSSCQGPITWSIDPGALGPRRARLQVGMLTWAFDQWRAASGLQFRFDGIVSTRFVRASQDLEPADGSPRGRHIWITWLSPAAAPTLAGRTSGFAAPDRIAGGVISGARAVFKSAYVAENASRRPERVKALYLHEIGHVLGLGHASTPRNRMFAIVDARTRLGAGDISGVRALTRDCAGPA